MVKSNYQRFIDSMAIGFNEWHDGIGYDLDALAQLSQDERLLVEHLLITNLCRAGDWRDVEALAALPTPTARRAVERARYHPRAEVRNRAIDILFNDPGSLEMDELEDLLVQAVEQGACDMAIGRATPKVKRALLACARNTDRPSRYHAASVLLYVCGLVPDTLAWEERPFLLAFANDDPEVLKAACEELARRTGM